MKILFLMNVAHGHVPFYAMVGQELVSQGHETAYAFDSHYPRYLHPNVSVGGPVRYFSEYFRQHFERRTPPPELEGANLLTIAFPDIDRMADTEFGRPNDPGYYDSLLANLGHFFVGLMNEERPDGVVYENVSNAFAYMAYEVCRRRGIPYLGFTSSRLPKRTDLMDTPTRSSRLEATFHAVRSKKIVPSAEVRAFVREYLDNFDKKVPDYMSNQSPFTMGVAQRYLFRKKPLTNFLRALHYRFREPDDCRFAFQVADPLRAYPEQFFRETLRGVKCRVLGSRLYRADPDLSRPYFAYPLQFHPESATSVCGPAFNDEFSNISGIIQNLPFGMSLYVKDHAVASGRQPLAFYRKLARLPNVVLVHPYFPTKTLLRHAKAVVCNTSTMGYEALVLQKPVFVLGHPFYDFHPSCVRIHSFDGAFEKLSRWSEVRTNSEDVEAFVTAYCMCSIEGMFDLLLHPEDRNTARRIARVIEQSVRELSHRN